MKELFDPVQAFAETRSRRIRQLRMLAPILILLVTAAYAQSIGMLPGRYVDVEYTYLAAAVLTLGGLAYTLAHWRCPVCRKNLCHWLNPEYCPGCGTTLRK
jgi:hypothetical protein